MRAHREHEGGQRLLEQLRHEDGPMGCHAALLLEDAAALRRHAEDHMLSISLRADAGLALERIEV